MSLTALHDPLFLTASPLRTHIDAARAFTLAFVSLKAVRAEK